MYRKNFYNDIPRGASSVDPKFLVPRNNTFEQNPRRILQNDFQMNSQIEQIANHTNNQEMIYFEYEIVNKSKEEEVINNKLKGRGLCLCKVYF